MKEQAILSAEEFRTAWQPVHRIYAPSEQAINYWSEHGGELLLATHVKNGTYFEVLKRDSFYHIIDSVSVGLVSADVGDGYSVVRNPNVDAAFVDGWINQFGSPRLRVLRARLPTYAWELVYSREYLNTSRMYKYEFHLMCDRNKYNTGRHSVSFNLANVHYSLVGAPPDIYNFIIDSLVEKERADLVNKILSESIDKEIFIDILLFVGIVFFENYDFYNLYDHITKSNRNSRLLTSHIASSFSPPRQRDYFI